MPPTLDESCKNQKSLCAHSHIAMPYGCNIVELHMKCNIKDEGGEKNIKVASLVVLLIRGAKSTLYFCIDTHVQKDNACT